MPRTITLQSIRWPVLPGQGWSILLERDSVELPSLAVVASALIRWKSGTNAEQTRDLVLNTATRTNEHIEAVYVFQESDLQYLEQPTQPRRPTEARGYVTMVLEDGSKKESRETIVLPLRYEFE